MTLIKISEEGLNGYELIPTMHCTQEIMVCSKTSYPLTEPGEPNSEVEAELVWQVFSDGIRGYITENKSGLKSFAEFEIFWFDKDNIIFDKGPINTSKYEKWQSLKKRIKESQKGQ